MKRLPLTESAILLGVLFLPLIVNHMGGFVKVLKAAAWVDEFMDRLDGWDYDLEKEV